MGTSKSYVAPASKEWSNAKKAVTKMVKNPSGETRHNVVQKYLIALGEGEGGILNDKHIDYIAFVEIVSRILFLITCIENDKLEKALQYFKREDLINENGTKILKELLDEWYETFPNNSFEFTKKAVKKTLQKLKIVSVEDMKSIDIIDFISEIIMSLLTIIFMLNFEENIKNDTSVERGRIIIEGYIVTMEKEIKKLLQDKINKDSFSNIDEAAKTIKDILSIVLSNHI